MLNYDPNIAHRLQVVRLRYARWDFKATVDIEVRGTDQGFETFEWALELHWEQLARAGAQDEAPRLVLTNEHGVELVLEDDALLQVDWLKDFCVGAEIVSCEPCEPAAAEGRAVTC